MFCETIKERSFQAVIITPSARNIILSPPYTLGFIRTRRLCCIAYTSLIETNPTINLFRFDIREGLIDRCLDSWRAPCNCLKWNLSLSLFRVCLYRPTRVKYRFPYTPVLFEIFEKGEGYLNLTTIGGCFKFYLSKRFIRDIIFLFEKSWRLLHAQQKLFCCLYGLWYD